MPINSKPQYYPSLDGLRAVSIIAVILFHANSIWLEGGFLGVESFFAISGFIITTLLLDHWQATGTLNLLRFWQRRCRRLLPGIITTVLGTAFTAVVFYPEELGQIREDLLPGITFTSNWFYIINERSYFELAGRPRLFEHLWSLAVEFQYYLLWPLLCLALFRCSKTTRILFCLVGALAASSWMAFLYQPGEDPSRIYFGTDTRISGLLLGSAAAFAMPAGVLAVSFGKACLADILGGVALMSLLVLFVYMDEMHTFLYQGGFACIALLTTLCIATSILHGKGWVATLLSWKPLRIIGLRAYNIYLWHWPVFCLSQPWLDVPLDGVALLALRIGIIAVLTEISYRWIDTPIRTGWLTKTFREMRQSSSIRRRRLAAVWLGSSGVFATGFTALLFAGQGIFNNENTQSIAAEQAALLGINGAPSSATPMIVAVPGIQTEDGEESLVEESAANTEDAQDIRDDGQANAAAKPVEGACGWEQGYLATGNVVSLPLEFAATNSQQMDMAWFQIFTSTVYGIGIEKPSLGERPILAGATDNPFQWRGERSEVWAAQPKAVLSMASKLSSDADSVALDDACQLSCGAVSAPHPAGGSAVQSGCPAGLSSTSAQPVSFKVKTRDTNKGTYIVRVYPAEEDKREVFAIGDSVMLGAASQLGHTIGDIDVDAQVGRQLVAGTALLAERKRKDLLGNTVVVHLGNNGPINSRQLTEMLEVLKDTQRVVLVNLKVPRSYEAANNALLNEASAKYPNVTVVDWRGPSLTANKVFAHDGLHLTGQGVRLYAKLISQTLCQAHL